MRIRTIKPEFFNHEALFEAERQSKLPLRLAFIGLWCAADREGRFKWEPRRLGVQIMPYDQIDFARVLDALMTRGFLVKYATETGAFGHIPTFAKHQVINNRERPSELPEPPQFVDNQQIDASTTREARDEHASKAEGKGRERKGMEQGTRVEHALPFASPDFAQAWQDWKNYRAEIKKPINSTMEATQLRQLAKLNERRAIAMIEHTIFRGWQGLREEDNAADIYPDPPPSLPSPPARADGEPDPEDLVAVMRWNNRKREEREALEAGSPPTQEELALMPDDGGEF